MSLALTAVNGRTIGKMATGPISGQSKGLTIEGISAKIVVRVATVMIVEIGLSGHISHLKRHPL